MRDQVRELAGLYGREYIEATNMDSYVDEERTVRINYYYTSGTIMKQIQGKKRPLVVREATLETIEKIFDNK